MYRHWWFSGRILARHVGGPGPILGQCKTYLFLLYLHFLDIESLIYPQFFKPKQNWCQQKFCSLSLLVQSETDRFHMTSVRYRLVTQNSETATSPVGVEPFPYVKTFHFFFLPINLHSYWSGRLKRVFFCCFSCLVGSLNNNVGDGCENVTYCREKWVRANLIPSPSFRQILANFSRVEF